jgi:cytochrome d ubiquinol oxidase subunit I
MDTLLSARALMGISLAFHIVYVAFGIGMPFNIMVAEGLALRTGNEMYHQLARRWVRPLVVLVAIGAVSGTVLSFELGLLWPRFMAFSGALIGLPFWLEAFAFFIEAIFLSAYIYGERRLSRRVLFLCTSPVVIGSIASAVFVISANSWMNTPAGFQLAGSDPIPGNLTDVDPLRAFANPAWLHELLHGTLATYIACNMMIAGVYALAILRGHLTEYNKKALTLALAVAGVAAPLQIFLGDFAAVSVARLEPAKLAAMEALFHTTQGAPETILGWPDPARGEVLYALKIPRLLSVLAYQDPNATVQGLDAFPPGTTADPRLTHLSFDLMVGLGFLMAIVVIWFWALRWRRREVPVGKWTMRAVLIASPLGLIAQELGWFTTEFGRQPWIAVGSMRVAQGVTPDSGIDAILVAFVVVYLALTVGLLRLVQVRGDNAGRSAVQGGPHGFS